MTSLFNKFSKKVESWEISDLQYYQISFSKRPRQFKPAKRQ